MKSIRLSLCLSLFVIAPISAAPYNYNAPQTYQGPSPAEMLQEAIEKTVFFLSQSAAANPDQFLAFLDRNIAPYFDFQYMTRWSAGRHYRYLNPEQLMGMERKIRRMFLQAMAEKLINYRPGRIEYSRPKMNPRNGDLTLSIRTYRPDGYHMQLDFRLYLGPNGWRVFDVGANGISAVAHYRDYFAQQFSSPTLGLGGWR